jgi:hypothetical protein
MARMPRRGLEGLGGGKESTLKSVKTASRTRKVAGAREGRPRRCREREKQANNTMFSTISFNCCRHKDGGVSCLPMEAGAQAGL